MSRASRIKTKLESALQSAALKVEDISHLHADHAAVKEMVGGANETHFNVRIVSRDFEGKSLVKRHRMVYDLLSDELNSGLHALSIIAQTPKEAGIDISGE
ncbi:hypothetical protein F511_01264 [Dorcoceras hygrometricum]|uniref:Uncharacterized protein n=1 Tax=Dorcoceras hygrometricum TaxID=472368 RepID=A0A2Z7BSX5_9LAMI|nr:hypothetical protein F511_01264 [Dorcoceras hygrometricum]